MLNHFYRCWDVCWMFQKNKSSKVQNIDLLTRIDISIIVWCITRLCDCRFEMSSYSFRESCWLWVVPRGRPVFYYRDSVMANGDTVCWECYDKGWENTPCVPKQRSGLGFSILLLTGKNHMHWWRLELYMVLRCLSYIVSVCTFSHRKGSERQCIM